MNYLVATLLSTIILSTTNIIIPSINYSNSYYQGTAQNYYTVNWSNNNNSLQFENRYYNLLKIYCIKTINVGNFDISKYKTVSLFDPNKESYTATTWGSITYYGTPFREKLNNLAIESAIFHRKISTETDLENNDVLKFEVLNTTVANIQSNQYIGLSYYTENGSNYIQVFIKQYVKIIRSWTNGLMIINLGKGIIFYSE